MRVISRKRLKEFWIAHPRTEIPLKDWYKKTCVADWVSVSDVRKTYPHADAVKTDSGTTATVFNVSKTGVRIITIIFYGSRRVYIRWILQHDEYMRGAWKERL